MDKYAESTGVISAGASRAMVRVIHTDEERMIAKAGYLFSALAKK